MNYSQHERYMRNAIEQAEEALLEGEVPIGAVIIQNGELIGTGRNRREKCRNALLHAEIEAIDSACKRLGAWRLNGCTLYVTLEPCPMCAGAIINARIGTVVFGARDPKAGSCGSVIDLFACPFNHRPNVVSGVLEQECAAVLKKFFSCKRKKP